MQGHTNVVWIDDLIETGDTTCRDPVGRYGGTSEAFSHLGWDQPEENVPRLLSLLVPSFLEHINSFTHLCMHVIQKPETKVRPAGRLRPTRQKVAGKSYSGLKLGEMQKEE